MQFVDFISQGNVVSYPYFLIQVFSSSLEVRFDFETQGAVYLATGWRSLWTVIMALATGTNTGFLDRLYKKNNNNNNKITGLGKNGHLYVVACS